MEIKYKPVQDFIGWHKAEGFIRNLITTYNFKSILEVGAGANPTIKSDFIKEHNLDYLISDIELTELDKADNIYRKVVLDFSKPIQEVDYNCDFIFSRMTGEHISDGMIFHKNIFNFLNRGGYSFHCFSTLYALPFLANRLLPDSISDFLLGKIAPRDSHQHAKFKAYYDWCRGPSGKMISNYKELGYEIIEYVGYFGHNYYNKIPLVRALEKTKTKILLKLKLPFLTAYSHILLKKP